MRKLGMYLAVVLSLVCVEEVNLQANPLPGCYSEWCHYTTPNILYDDFEWGHSIESIERERNDWMASNCPNWPDINDPVFRVLPYFDMQDEYKDDIKEVWWKDHPKDNGISSTTTAKQYKEYYLGKQREKYGRNIPYCLTEKAQSRIAQERKETEKYLQDAPNVPMVRDRVVLLAKIEEANAKTAKEQGLENLYKKPEAWKINKATLEGWWAETHPNGKPLDKNAIKQRYKDYFTKQEWKKANPNTPEPSIEEIRTWGEQKKIQDEQRLQKEREDYENKIVNFWNANFPNWPEADLVGFSGEKGAYQYYQSDIDDLWLKYYKEHAYTDCTGVCKKRYQFSEPFEEREKFYLNKQRELYGQNIPFCLTKTVQKFLRKGKSDIEKYLRDDTASRDVFEENLQGIIAAEQANIQIATELGLDLNRPLGPLWDPVVSFPSEAERIDRTSGAKPDSMLRLLEGSIDDTVELAYEEARQETEETRAPKKFSKTYPFAYLIFVGLVAAVIVGGAIIILLKRKKNLPK